MGIILESTPEMGSTFNVEVRRETFILLGPGDDDRIEVYLDDLPKVRAALDLVENYRKMKSR